jgi:hypothetical protein
LGCSSFVVLFWRGEVDDLHLSELAVLRAS